MAAHQDSFSEDEKIVCVLPLKRIHFQCTVGIQVWESFEWVQNKCGWCVDFELNLW